MRMLPIVLHWFLQDQKFVTQLKNGDEKECPICYVQFNIPELHVRFYFNIFEYILNTLLNLINLQMVVRTDCSHYFHAEC